MANKYKDTISKIKVDDDFKQKLINDLEAEQIKINKKERIFMKLKSVVIGLFSTAFVLAGTGAAYAALGGTINGVPVIEYLGINFSDKYEEYVEFVPEEEKQVVENDRAALTLQYSMGDDGFVVLDFDLKYKEPLMKELKDAHNKREEAEKYAKEENYIYEKVEYESLEEDMLKPYNISFNDFFDEEYGWHDINSSYSNIIIDGENFNIRGREAEKIGFINYDEFDVTKMWLLTDSELNGKTEFTITLKNPVINYSEDKYEQIEGEFNIKVSKEKALKDTTSFENKGDKQLKYNRLTEKVEKVTRTPMQDIIKIKTVISNVTADNTYELTNKDFLSELNDYVLYDYYGGKVNAFVQYGEVVYEYKDGTKYTSIPGEYEIDKELDGGTITTYTYVIIGTGPEEYEIRSLTRNDYYNTVTEVGVHNINTKTKTIDCENSGIIYKNVDWSIYLMDKEIVEKTEENNDFYDESYIESANYVDLTKEIL